MFIKKLKGSSLTNDLLFMGKAKSLPSNEHLNSLVGSSLLASLRLRWGA
jgi:hypothetical protein